MSVHFYHRKGSPVTMTIPWSSLGISRGDSICLCVSLWQRGKCEEYNSGYYRTGLEEGLCESVPVATCPSYYIRRWTPPQYSPFNIMALKFSKDLANPALRRVVARGDSSIINHFQFTSRLNRAVVVLSAIHPSSATGSLHAPLHSFYNLDY